MEWNVNVTGVQPNSTFRMDIIQYYEVVPDESVRDNYCPKKNSSSSDPDLAMKIAHKTMKVVLDNPVSDFKKDHITDAIWNLGSSLIPEIGALRKIGDSMGLNTRDNSSRLFKGLSGVPGFLT
jgi:hypothetical protein